MTIPPFPPRFINWRMIDGNKVPVSRSGQQINAFNPTHHGTYEEASQSDHPVAFVVLKQDGLFFLDLDKCKDSNGGWTPAAQELFMSFTGAWGEISQSGQGLHIMGHCDPSRLGGLRNKWDGWKEFYTDRRMVAFGKTGWEVIGGSEDAGKDFTDTILQIVPAREIPKTQRVSAPEHQAIQDDEELIQKMLASMGGAGAKFGLKCKVADLWYGNQSELVRNYPSDTKAEGFDPSSADLALMTHLAFWTDRNDKRMDRLFRRSALMRKKYAKREDYRTRTIEKAIASVAEGYGGATSSGKMPTGTILVKDTNVWKELPNDLLGQELQPPPSIDPAKYLPASLSDWVIHAAAAKSAPVDYVFFTVLSAAASLIGNARRAKPRPGWTEATGLWVMVVGNPSAGKSPALDAVIDVVRRIEEPVREAAKRKRAEWQQKKVVAERCQKDWEKKCEKAFKDGTPLPEQPDSMKLPEEPHVPRLMITDCTIEKLGIISAAQPKGILQVRDELSGWLEGMTRYSTTSDRPFWLEANGGRPYSIERVSREEVTVPRLLISVIGGIQPDRLNTLLIRADDDGLLARIIPVWPDPVPLVNNVNAYCDELLYRVFDKLQRVEMAFAWDLTVHPLDLEFDVDAQDELFRFRQHVKSLEAQHEGFFVSFLGKAAGLAVRLSLVLAYLRWASTEATSEPKRISAKDISLAIDLVETYILPMATRTYAAFAGSPERRGARGILHIIRDKQLREFSARDLHRAAGKNIKNANELHKYLDELVYLGAIRAVDELAHPKVGRPSSKYVANPFIWDRSG